MVIVKLYYLQLHVQNKLFFYTSRQWSLSSNKNLNFYTDLGNIIITEINNRYSYLG